VISPMRAQGWLEGDPTGTIERQQMRYSGDYDFYDRDQIDALIAAAAGDQDATVYLTASMTGLRRGELVGLRSRDVDFAGQAIRVRAGYSFGEPVTPKSGKVRSVPMVPELAQALALLRQREFFTDQQHPVFAGAGGGHLDASALRPRYAKAVQRAGLRPLPFHSLRHYFGSMAMNRASLVQVQARMGHSHIQTTAATCTPRARRTMRRCWRAPLRRAMSRCRLRPPDAQADGRGLPEVRLRWWWWDG